MQFLTKSFLCVSFLAVFFLCARVTVPHLSWATIDKSISCIAFPLMKIHSFIAQPLYAFVHQKWSIVELQKTVDQLYEEKQKYMARLVELEAALRFSNQVSGLCEFKKRYTHDQALIGQIIMRVFTENEHLAFVDRGERHGITPGMVAVYENHLIGRVSEVFPFYCKVILITDTRCKVAAWCGFQQARGIHEGKMEEYTTLKHVSHLETVRVGDMVISSGEGTIFPYGLALGTVIFCLRDDVCYSVTVKPMIDIQKLDYCLIVQKSAYSHL